MVARLLIALSSLLLVAHAAAAATSGPWPWAWPARRHLLGPIRPWVGPVRLAGGPIRPVGMDLAVQEPHQLSQLSDEPAAAQGRWPPAAGSQHQPAMVMEHGAGTEDQGMVQQDIQHHHHNMMMMAPPDTDGAVKEQPEVKEQPAEAAAPVAAGSSDQAGMGAAAGAPTATTGCPGQYFMPLIHLHGKIQRRVVKTPAGIESLTTSDDPEIAHMIKEHVASMKALLEACARGACPAMLPRMHDPLFAAVYNNADKLSLTVKELDNGVAVSETGEGALLARLVQAHAGVVSQFVKKGMDEMMVPHPAPPANRKLQ